MKRPEELSHMLTEMYNDTKDGKIHWNISVQTTENNEVSEKPVEVEDGVSWTIDECYVSYYCKYKGQDFLMIIYEMIKTAGLCAGQQGAASGRQERGVLRRRAGRVVDGACRRRL